MFGKRAGALAAPSLLELAGQLTAAARGECATHACCIKPSANVQSSAEQLRPAADDLTERAAGEKGEMKPGSMVLRGKEKSRATGPKSMTEAGKPKLLPCDRQEDPEADTCAWAQLFPGQPQFCRWIDFAA